MCHIDQSTCPRAATSTTRKYEEIKPGTLDAKFKTVKVLGLKESQTPTYKPDPALFKETPHTVSEDDLGPEDKYTPIVIPTARA